MGREPGIRPAQLTCPNTDTDYSDQSVPVLFAPLFLEGREQRLATDGGYARAPTGSPGGGTGLERDLDTSCESAAMSALLFVPLTWHLRVGSAGWLDGWGLGESFGPQRRAADLPGVVAQRRGGALDRAGQFVRGEPLAQMGHQMLIRCRFG